MTVLNPLILTTFGNFQLQWLIIISLTSNKRNFYMFWVFWEKTQTVDVFTWSLNHVFILGGMGKHNWARNRHPVYEWRSTWAMYTVDMVVVSPQQLTTLGCPWLATSIISLSLLTAVESVVVVEVLNMTPQTMRYWEINMLWVAVETLVYINPVPTVRRDSRWSIKYC